MQGVLLGSREVVAALEAFLVLLRRDEQELNAINVFPVADADTGTNLVKTLAVVVAATQSTSHLPALAKAVANAALFGRGNSGLIVGQYLTGFTAELATLSEPAGGPALNRCFVAGSVAARRAVVDPVSGTVLSVAEAVASSESHACAGDLAASARSAEVMAKEALARTTSQLPALEAAGVVDSGGAGLVLFFEALAGVLSRTPTIIECRTGFPQPAPPIGPVVGYEVRFLVPTGKATANELASFLASIGTDVVIAEANGLVRAHVHVEDANVAAGAISARFEAAIGKAISYEVEPLIEHAR